MPHQVPLIATVCLAFVLAAILGYLATRLRLSPIVGYLFAGLMVGPYTPGFVADTSLAPQLAELGVILLMFGVGLHFTPRDLLRVWSVAVPGAVAQIAVATLVGLGLSLVWGWSAAGGLVFGLSLSVASTVVLLRALEEQRALETEKGRVAIGWLVVEDLAMVLVLVLLPVLAGLARGQQADMSSLAVSIGTTLGAVALFVALMLVVGRRVIPAMLALVARTGSRELFTLSVLGVALGIAYGSALLFGVSFALGAFFAGLVLGESDLSHRAAEGSLPLRDAFAVLFFVSVGMLFDPSILLRRPLDVAAVLTVILLVKSAAAVGLVRLLGRSHAMAATVAASLAQIGEFSFILIGLGIEQGLVPTEARDLIVAGAMISIALNPFVFKLAQRWAARFVREEGAAEPVDEEVYGPHQPHGDGPVILIGLGRVGSAIAAQLTDAKVPLVVVDQDRLKIERWRQRGGRGIVAVGSPAEVLQNAGIAGARLLMVTVPDELQGGALIEAARRMRRDLFITARAHSEDGVEHLRGRGADLVVYAEREVAGRMVENILGV
ncbi:YbaL family putative K(+) efflux transporter [Ancylobacter oerskovii]|uniref:YbaL family putative K(+) efflux transporter n=1 Tax=Ancylobacter oerskovii TaxID=459519 RepID=A0ABW4YYG7_9HYPH|nr:YbaL family putative K(+) efflux transporter [Ancylobacter oerskovii]MBS7541765.1 Kef family K(+) transporter [Ancylobacter oerskovii]